MYTNLNRFLYKTCEKNLDNICAIDGNNNKKFSYKNLWEDSFMIAKYINYNYSEDKIFLIEGYSNYLNLTLMFGIILSRNICMIINSEDISDINKLMKDYDILLFITSSDSLNGNSSVENINTFLNNIKDIDTENIKLDVLDTDGNKTAFILLTSGTTGKRKGVLLSHKNICTSLESKVKVFDTNYGETKNIKNRLSILPINHILPLIVDVLCTLNDGDIICPVNRKEDYLMYIKKYQPEYTTLVPAMIKQIYDLLVGFENVETLILQKNRLLGEKLRIIFCGGAKLDLKYVIFFKNIEILIVYGYGLTESSGVGTISDYESYINGSVGKKLNNNKYIDIKIENSTVRLKGDSISDGYYEGKNKIEYIKDKDGWFNTKDIGYLDEDNNLYIYGRSDGILVSDKGKLIPTELLRNKINSVHYIKDSIIKIDKGKILVEIILNDNYIKDSEDIIENKLQEHIKKINESNPNHLKISNY